MVEALGCTLEVRQKMHQNDRSSTGFLPIDILCQSKDILWGFLSEDEKTSYGRPVGVTIGPDKASLLMADDVGDVIWRITEA